MGLSFPAGHIEAHFADDSLRCHNVDSINAREINTADAYQFFIECKCGRIALAWAEQDYIGRTDKEIVGGPEAEELTAIKRAVLDSGVRSRSETVVTFNGDRHYYDLTVEPMRGSSGTIQGVTCCV